MTHIVELPKLVHIEFMKSRHKHHFLLLIAMLVLNYFLLFKGIKNDGKQWLNVFYGIPLVNSILLSVYMAILASQAVDVENKGTMWNLIATLCSKRNIFLSKNLYGLIHIVLFCIIQISCVGLLGRFLGFHGNVPNSVIMITFFAEVISGMILFQVQCLISLLFPNQFAALSIGFGGTLTGLFLAFISKIAWTPWSVLISLSCVSMDYEESTRTMNVFWELPATTQIVVALIYLLCTFLIGLYLFSATEPGEALGSSGRVRATHSLHSSIPAELIKLKRNPVWIPFILIPVISATIGTINFTQNQGVLHFTWGDLWTQHSIFLSFFFLAPLIGVVCSLQWRMEHLGSNWNLILSVTSPFKLFKDKWAATSFVSSLCIIWLVVIYVVTGKILGIPDSIPTLFWSRILAMLISVMAITAVQNLLSLILHSFALPVAIAFLGCLSGVAFIMKGLYFLTPYSLLIYGAGSTSITENLNLPMVLISASIWIFASIAVGILFIKSTDVRTHV